MAGYIVQQVEHPTEEQLDYSAGLFTDLMGTDLSCVALSGGEPSLVKFQALALLRAGALVGEYYTATDPNGQIIGFTMWMPPGQDLFSTEEQRQLGFYDFMARMPDAGKKYIETAYLADFPAFVNGILGPTGKKDAWWMHMCMVRPDYHRKGVARALIKLVHEKASKKGELLACSTTNDNNIAVYTSIGFTLRGSRVMPSPWGDWPVHLFTVDTGKV